MCMQYVVRCTVNCRHSAVVRLLLSLHLHSLQHSLQHSLPYSLLYSLRYSLQHSHTFPMYSIPTTFLQHSLQHSIYIPATRYIPNNIPSIFPARLQHSLQHSPYIPSTFSLHTLQRVGSRARSRGSLWGRGYVEMYVPSRKASRTESSYGNLKFRCSERASSVFSIYAQNTSVPVTQSKA